MLKRYIYYPRYLQLLGTAAADYEGIERSKNKNCIEAVKLGGRNLRSPSSLFVYPDMLIDASSYITSQMQRFNIDANLIHYIAITHPHLDHFCPNTIINMLGDRKNLLRVYGDRSTIKILEETLKEKSIDIIDSKLRTKELIPFKRYKIGETYITPIRANHNVILSDSDVYIPKSLLDDKYKANTLECTSLNYILEIENKIVLYASDTALPLQETYRYLKRFKFDIVIYEATFKEKEDSNHMNFEKISYLKEKMLEDKIIHEKTIFVLTHLSLNYTPIYNKIKDYFLKEGIIVGYDGIVIPL